jgi:hypothetical protein
VDPTILLPDDAPVDYSTGENIGASPSSFGTTFAPPEDSGASYRPVSGDFSTIPFILFGVIVCALWALVSEWTRRRKTPAEKDPP